MTDTEPPRERAAAAPASLPATSHRLLVLLDHSLDVLELVAGNGVIEGVSSAVTALAGFQPADLVGKDYRHLIHPDDCALAAQTFRQVMDRGTAGPVTLRYRRQDGKWRTLRVRARNFLAEPSVRAIIVLTRDITDQLDAEGLLSTANQELHELSQQLLASQESERGHLARELHDDVQQMLFGLRLSMESVSKNPLGAPTSGVVAQWIELLQSALNHLHELTTGLRAPALDGRGLQPELAAYLARMHKLYALAIHSNVDSDLGELAPAMELACFRIVQEATSNAARHARAGNVWVDVHRRDGQLSLCVRDDGVGFDPAAAREPAVQRPRIGLLSMRERAAMAGGTLEVESHLAAGTTVSAAFSL